MNNFKKFTASVILLFAMSPIVYGLGSEVVNGGGSGAPTDATYITQTPNGDLTNEQAISSLSDGLLKHSSGVLAQAVAGTDYMSATPEAIKMYSTGASPQLEFYDTDVIDGDLSAFHSINCTNIGSGTENCDYAIAQQIAGVYEYLLVADADGGLDLDHPSGVTVGGNAIIDASDVASTTASGISELATAAEVTAGTDTGRTITPDALAGSDFGKRVVTVMLLSTSEICSTGDGAGDVMLRIPAELDGYNLADVAFGVDTAGTTGNFDIQIRNATQAADMLTSAMRVETGETDTLTSAQPGTIDAANDDVASGDKLYFDIDACQTTPAYGATLNLTFQLP